MRSQNVVGRLVLVAVLLLASMTLAGMSAPSQRSFGPSTASAPLAWGGWKGGWFIWGSSYHWPVVGRNQDGRLEVFAGVNDPNCFYYCVYHRWQTVVNDNESWDGPSRVGNSDAQIAPAVATNPGGRMEVFAQQFWMGFGGTCPGFHTEAGQVWQLAPNDGWSDWASMGQPTSTSTCPLVDLYEPYLGVNQDGRIDVFAEGHAPDGNVWHKWQTAPSDGWVAGWASIGKPTGLAGVSPVISTGLNQDGRMIVFVLGGGEIYQKWQITTGDENIWSGWVSFGHPDGVNLSDGASEPAVIQNRDGRLVFFTVGSDGAIWSKWQVAPNTYWSGWGSLGHPSGVNLSGPPVVGLHPNGAVDVFALGDDQAIWHIWEDEPNGAWSNWNSLGKPGSTWNFTNQLAVGRNQNGTLVLFGVTTDGWLWYNAEKLSAYLPLISK